MWETVNTQIQSPLALDRFISRLPTTEERISELEDTSMECSKMESKEKKDKGKKQNRISRDYGITPKGMTYI